MSLRSMTAQIRIKGSKDELERAVLASRPGAEPRSQMSRKRVNVFDGNASKMTKREAREHFSTLSARV